MGKKVAIDGKSTEAFSLFLDGKFSEENTRLGEPKGDILSTKIPEFLEEVYLELDKENKNFEDFFKTEKFNEILDKYIVKK